MSDRKAHRRPVLIDVLGDSLVLKASRLASPPLRAKPLVRPFAQPILKWAGGKQWLAPAAPHLVPPRWQGRYFEPFLGGAALFFAVEPARATLSDRNGELISTYRAIRDDVAGVANLLERYPYDKDFYYELRKRRVKSDRAHAARFLYLNRTCWNGLYRINQDGHFNTPFGRFKNPTICQRARLEKAARLLRRSKLRVGDFEEIISEARPGDFAYFDPPYITGHLNNGFLKYNAPLFSWEDQKRLALVSSRLARAGVFVLISNADQEAVLNLYRGLFFYRAVRRSLIAGSAACRGTVTEALLSNYPLLDCPSETL